MSEAPSAFEPDHHYVACFAPGTPIATLAIATSRFRPGATPLRDVVVARQWLGGGVTALNEAAELCRAYGVLTAATNEPVPQKTREYALVSLGLVLSHRETDEQGYRDMFESLRLLISLGNIRLPKDPFVRQDLLSLFRHLTAQGKVTIHVPTAKSGRHAEFAPTIARAATMPCAIPRQRPARYSSAERFAAKEAKEIEAAERRLEARYHPPSGGAKANAWSLQHFRSRVGR